MLYACFTSYFVFLFSFASITCRFQYMNETFRVNLLHALVASCVSIDIIMIKLFTNTSTKNRTLQNNINALNSAFGK